MSTAESTGAPNAVTKEWYGVKGLFRWHFKEGGNTANIEERIVLFFAESFEDALAQAEAEAAIYCEDDPQATYRIESLGWWKAFAIEDIPGQGIEVFSRLCKTDLNADAFLRRYYPKAHDR